MEEIEWAVKIDDELVLTKTLVCTVTSSCNAHDVGVDVDVVGLPLRNGPTCGCDVNN